MRKEELVLAIFVVNSKEREHSISSQSLAGDERKERRRGDLERLA